VIPVITGLKQPPAEWVARLREIDPIRDLVSCLEFVWDINSERWWLFECVPVYESETGPTVPLQILEELKGPDPELIPETCPLISHRQWLMFQKTGRWARPSWIIQGTKGGNLHSFDSATVELLQRTGRRSTPHYSGELPYADFDERVVQQILKMNKLYKVRNDLDAFRQENTGEGARRQYREALRSARAAQLAFLDEQFEEPAGHFVDAYRKGEYDAVGAPKLDVDWVERDAQESHNFIETGSFSTKPD